MILINIKMQIRPDRRGVPSGSAAPGGRFCGDGQRRVGGQNPATAELDVDKV